MMILVLNSWLNKPFSKLYDIELRIFNLCIKRWYAANADISI